MVRISAAGISGVDVSRDAHTGHRPIHALISWMPVISGWEKSIVGSAAYAPAEAFKWPTGLKRPIEKAWGFYGVLSVATLLGVAMNFTSLNPIKALFWSAVCQ
jgi:hypothetical protein